LKYQEKSGVDILNTRIAIEKEADKDD